jgi:hypothetical protein
MSAVAGRRRREVDFAHYKKTPTNTGRIMRDLLGKTAFVTGGASGIGFALGHSFADAGMKVMLA